MSTKAEALRRLDEAWQALEAAVGEFDGGEMLEPGVVDGWSVKDLLGHIAFWSGQAAKNIGLVAAGQADKIVRPDSKEATDQWNERERRRRQDWPLSQVREEWLHGHRQAREALVRLSEDQLDVDLGGETVLEGFAVDTYEHYEEHLEHILAWRRELETTEA